MDDDVPTRRPRTHLLALPGDRIGVFSSADAAGGVLEAADPGLGERLLAQVDGQRTVGEVIDASAPVARREEARGLLRRLLGTVLELPAVIAGLEGRIPRVEIVRFPMQTPYAVPRAYWSNAADVREALPALFAQLGSPTGFAFELSRLHVLATLGASGRSFHGGGGDTGVTPGRYRTATRRTHAAHPAMVAFVRERLGALGLADDLAVGREFESPTGAPLGRLSDGGCAVELREASPAWMADRLEELREALAALRAASANTGGSSDAIAGHAAAFHHLFCHVHPFERINNSIAMNVVDACLGEAGVGRLPHLLLDHFALRLDLGRYGEVFRDALARHALPRGDADIPRATRDELAGFRSRVASSPDGGAPPAAR